MTTDDAQYMTNAEGHLVPVAMIKPQHKLEDDLVMDLFDDAQALSEKMKTFKEHAFSDVHAFLEILHEKYGAGKGGKKGNVTLTSYDGLTKVQVSVSEFIQFGPELQVAKTLIDECISSWSEGSNDHIRTLVNHAFRVDKNNRVNTAAILGLRRLPIQDDKWQTAMDAISESMRVGFTRQYMRFYRRESSQDMWRAVNLDFAGS